MAKFVNLTPHEIVIRRDDGTDLRVPPSGTVARVETFEEDAPPVDGIPTVTRQFGRIAGLPPYDPRADVVYIVSALVLSALDAPKDEVRPDVVAPDTGVTAVRDADGRIIAVSRFVRPGY